ncbi:MAG: hypothetical protein LBG48_04410 [Rickettsiales bacterium]|jgi:hypothetical protein|nr:hypothetical protein [Rickettsiales bacterium]
MVTITTRKIEMFNLNIFANPFRNDQTIKIWRSKYTFEDYYDKYVKTEWYRELYKLEEYKKFCYYGGRFGGKTTAISMALIYNIFYLPAWGNLDKNLEYSIVISRKTATVIERSVWKDFIEVVRIFENDGVIPTDAFKFNKSNGIITTIKNISIYFIPDDPLRIQSNLSYR